MKRLFLLATILWGALYPIQAQKANSIPIDAAHFPDEIFREYIRVQFDLNHDGTLSKKERLQVYAIDINSFLISNLEGISYFSNLEALSCYNNPITSLDVLKDCHNLQGLYFGLNHHLSSVDLSECVNLKTLTVSYCWLQSLDLSGCANLQSFTFNNNSQLSSLNLNGCINLQTLSIQGNSGLQALNISGCTTSSSTNFAGFNIENNPNFTSLNLNGCTRLYTLQLRNNNLESISLKACPSLRSILCDNNQLTSLDLSSCDEYNVSITYSNNKRYILQNENRTFDLNQLPNFDITKTDNWDGGFLTGTILTFIKDTVSYDYDISSPDGLTARFTLILTDDIPNASEDPDDSDDPNDSDDPDNSDDPDDSGDPDDSDDTDDPWTSVQPVSEAPADLFSVHPVPFRQTLHIETALNLQSVSLYNMQGRLCARFEHGFDALPTAGLEPGLYLLLLETADGATYRLKAIKE